jgi:hypothetical protein
MFVIVTFVPKTSQMSVNDTSRIIIDDTIVILQIVASHTSKSGGIIYDCNMFRVQANEPTLAPWANESLKRTDPIVCRPRS